MISCSQIEERLVTLTCDKMKEAEPFAPRILELAVFDVGDDRKSLAAIASPFTKTPSKVDSENAKLMLALLKGFPPEGATNTQWKDAFIGKGGKASTFNRIVKTFLEKREVKHVGSGKGAKYVLATISSVSVPDQCHVGITTPSNIGVTSPPPLGVIPTPIADGHAGE